MTDLALHPRTGLRLNAAATLERAATFWFLVAVAGQAIFAWYIIAFYGGAAWRGDLAAWSKVLSTHGIVRGDSAGNFFLGLHLALAAIITLGGPVQLLPWLRRRLPALHRWNGRAYLVTAFVTSLAALYLVFTRGTLAGTYMTIGVVINAALILLCAGLTLRYALAREIAAHRRWALRTFMVVSGVWFFRVGLMLWFFLNQGPVGHTDAFDGPFDIVLSFAFTTVPLIVLELYLRARDGGSSAFRFGMAATLVVSTLLMGMGIAMAGMFMWGPRM